MLRNRESRSCLPHVVGTDPIQLYPMGTHSYESVTPVQWYAPSVLSRCQPTNIVSIKVSISCFTELFKITKLHYWVMGIVRLGNSIVLSYNSRLAYEISKCQKTRSPLTSDTAMNRCIMHKSWYCVKWRVLPCNDFPFYFSYDKNFLFSLWNARKDQKSL